MAIVRVAAAVGLVTFGAAAAAALDSYSRCLGLDCAGASMALIFFSGLTIGSAVLVGAWVVEVFRRRTAD